MVAVNVGGAVIPTLMSIYLLIRRELWAKGLVATAIVALVIVAAAVAGRPQAAKSDIYARGGKVCVERA